jgi:hypothetical protein
LHRLKDTKGSGYCSLLDVAGVDGSLVVGPHQVDLGEETTTRWLVGVIMYVANGIAVGDGSGVESSIIVAGTPTVALGHNV